MLDPIGAQKQGYDLSNISVLIVDDNEFTRKLLLSVLNSLNIRRVYVAHDGVSGYQVFLQSAVDLIIVDWEMEPVNGPQFVKRVRKDESSPNPYIPIMMVTAHTDISNVMAARDVGVNEFLAKPVSPLQVYERMVRILESTRPFVRTATYFGPDRRRRKDPNYRGRERRKNNDPGKK